MESMNFALSLHFFHWYHKRRRIKHYKNLPSHIRWPRWEELDGPAISALDVRSRKLSNIGRSSDGWPKIYDLELLRTSEGTFGRWYRLYLQPLAPTNPHWARVVGYGPFPMWVIHKEGLGPSSGDINRLMMVRWPTLAKVAQLPRSHVERTNHHRVPQY
jgi:hypothetical protein